MGHPSPSQIVARAEDPSNALAAFIAQELEAWGFRTHLLEEHPHTVAVGTESWQGYVEVREVK